MRVGAGKLEALHVAWREAATAIQLGKPDALVFLSFLDSGADRASVIHVFGSAEAMDRHFKGADERSRVAAEYDEGLGWEVYGRPSDAAFSTLRDAAQRADVELTVYPELVSGFLRV